MKNTPEILPFVRCHHHFQDLVSELYHSLLKPGLLKHPVAKRYTCHGGEMLVACASREFYDRFLGVGGDDCVEEAHSRIQELGTVVR